MAASNTDSFQDFNTFSPSTETGRKRKWFMTLPGILTIALVSCTTFMFIAACLNINSAEKMDNSGTKRLLDDISLKVQDLLNAETATTERSSTTQFPYPPAPLPSDKECSIEDDWRIDCHPEEGATKDRCLQRGCCWKDSKQIAPTYDDPAPVNVAQCFFSTSYQGYRVIEGPSMGGDSVWTTLERVIASGLPDDIRRVTVNVTFYDYYTARITIKDADRERYVPMVPVIADKRSMGPRGYNATIDASGALTIVRLSDGVVLFSANLAQLIFSNQFIQLTTKVPSDYYYGLGEMKGAFQKKFNRTRRILFNKDQPPRWNRALYGAHGLMLNVENSGNASGIFILNTNPMDVVLLPSKTATFRTIGGILDFFVYIGTTPSQVVQQHQAVVGLPSMPPYWALGFHLCRYGYWNLTKTKQVYERNINNGVYVETMWNDIDYMDKFNMFTYDAVNFKGLPEFIKSVHDSGRHYMLIFDPAVSGSEADGTYPPFDIGVKMDIFLKNMTGDIAEYKVWNEKTSIFPDFTHPKIQEYWGGLFKTFYDTIHFDGAWIDMNEPSNQLNGTREGCANSEFDQPPVVIGGEALNTFTVCMSDKHFDTEHYNVHNIYPHLEARAVYRALADIRKKRPFIISRSSYPGQGVWSGHWTGDIDSSWEDMRQSIPDILNFGIYGMPIIGADICGFQYNTTEELCTRWQALGAFYPFMRNHNDKWGIEQDPAVLGPRVLAATKKTLERRLFLLPYLYTLFFFARSTGSTVARSLMMNFPEDLKSHSVDTQFMWGDALMIAPALFKGQENVSVYLPESTWFHVNTDYNPVSAGQQEFAVMDDDIHLFIRGGTVIPCQKYEPVIRDSRKNPFSIIVALDANQTANGYLFWDDGDSIDTVADKTFNLVSFRAVENALITTVEIGGYEVTMIADNITIIGVNNQIDAVTLNGKALEKSNFKYNHEHTTLTIYDVKIDLRVANLLTWT